MTRNEQLIAEIRSVTSCNDEQAQAALRCAAKAILDKLQESDPDGYRDGEPSACAMVQAAELLAPEFVQTELHGNQA